MVTELSKAGGLLPVVKSYTVPVHWCAFAGGMPLWQQVLAGIVLAFYVFFLVEEWQKIRKQGFLKYWSFKNFVSAVASFRPISLRCVSCHILYMPRSST